jgi:hypothetical protein
VFGLLRLIGLVAVLAVAAVVIEPSWSSSKRALTLRVRSASECVEVVRALGGRVSDDRIADKRQKKERKRAKRGPAPVAAGPVALDERPQERLTDADRESLDQLIEEKTREE